MRARAVLFWALVVWTLLVSSLWAGTLKWNGSAANSRVTDFLTVMGVIHTSTATSESARIEVENDLMASPFLDPYFNPEVFTVDVST